MSASSRIIPPGGFFSGTDFDFEARIALGAVGAGDGLAPSAAAAQLR